MDDCIQKNFQTYKNEKRSVSTCPFLLGSIEFQLIDTIVLIPIGISNVDKDNNVRVNEGRPKLIKPFKRVTRGQQPINVLENSRVQLEKLLNLKADLGEKVPKLVRV